MRTIKILLIGLATMIATSCSTPNGDATADRIIAMEKSALEQWNNGNPSGYLDIYADDIVYFDPFTEQRVDGLKQLTTLYESIRGQILVDRYEMKNPKVQASDSMAVLTFNLYSYSNDNLERWNCTEVYRLEKNGSWKIIQTHWSFTQPNIAASK